MSSIIKSFKADIDTNVSFHGKYPVTASKATFKKYVSIELAQEKAQELLNRIKDATKDRSYKYQVSFFVLPIGEWRSGRWFDTDVSVPTFEEYEDSKHLWLNVSDMIIYKSEKPPPKGGCLDKKGIDHHDCLYYAIKDGLYGRTTNLPKYPNKFKEWLNLSRDEPIDYKDVNRIEEKIKCNIHVHGDYTYQSPRVYPRTVNVNSINGHYKYKAPSKVYKQLYKQSKPDLKLVYFKKELG